MFSTFLPSLSAFSTCVTITLQVAY